MQDSFWNSTIDNYLRAHTSHNVEADGMSIRRQYVMWISVFKLARLDITRITRIQPRSGGMLILVKSSMECTFRFWITGSHYHSNMRTIGPLSAELRWFEVTSLSYYFQVPGSGWLFRLGIMINLGSKSSRNTGLGIRVPGAVTFFVEVAA